MIEHMHDNIIDAFPKSSRKIFTQKNVSIHLPVPIHDSH